MSHGANRRIWTNALWLTAGHVAVKPIWFLFVTAVTMRVLSPAGYGVVTASLSLSALTLLFSEFGTAEYATRAVARDRSTASEMFSNLLSARGALAVAIWLVLLGIGALLDYPIATLAWAGVYTVAFRLTELCRAFYRGYERLRSEAGTVVVEKTLVVLCGTASLLLYRTPTAAVAGMAVGMMMTLVLVLRSVHRGFARFDAQAVRPRRAAMLMWLAIPMGMVGLFTTAYIRGAIVLVEAMRGEAEAGQFGAAFRVVEALQIIPAVVVAATMAPLSALAHQGRVADFRRLVVRSAAVSGVVSVPIALALTIGGPWVVGLLSGGSDYGEAGRLLQTLCWLFPLTSLNYPLSTALFAADRQRTLAVLYGIAAATALVLGWVLIPERGGLGAAWALLIGDSIPLIGMALLFVRRFMHRPLVPEAI